MRIRVFFAASVLASTALVPGTTAQASVTSDDLSATLLSSTRAAHFDELIDCGPEGDACADAFNPAGCAQHSE
jgi:hypothetical protein